MAELFHELGIDPRIIAAQIAGFVLLWMLLAKFLFRPVKGLLDSRKQDIEKTYSDADTARSEAEQLKSELDQRLAVIEAEARARMQEAVKEAKNAKNEILADAKNRSDDILRRGQEELVRERDKTLAQLKEEVVDISITAAGKIIGETLDDSKHRKLVSDFVDGIGTNK